ncbi:MAG: HAD hydrolase-like protein [Akkermansiaceae bacterium]
MHLLFDLDGTLTDPAPGISRCIQHALESLGKTPPASTGLHWCIGPPLHASFLELLKTTDHDLADRAVALYRERFSSIGLFENEVYPGIETALKQLTQDGHQLHLATSKPTIFATRIIDHFGLTRFFQSINGSELDGTNADKTDLIRHILAEQAIAPHQAIMIGDRKFDIIGALENQLTAIGVLWGYGTAKELQQAKATSLLVSPAQLYPEITKASFPGKSSSSSCASI